MANLVFIDNNCVIVRFVVIRSKDSENQMKIQIYTLIFTFFPDQASCAAVFQRFATEITGHSPDCRKRGGLSQPKGQKNKEK
jgi:hypothetical protein